MATKLQAARICMNSGCYMAIANGNILEPINEILKNNKCTWFITNVI